MKKYERKRKEEREKKKRKKKKEKYTVNGDIFSKSINSSVLSSYDVHPSLMAPHPICALFPWMRSLHMNNSG